MPYEASIDRTNPGCFLFLVDQSSSMTQPLGGQPDQPKMNAAADAVNRVLDNLAQRCSRGADIRDYFHLGVLGYGHAFEVPYDDRKDYYYLDENEVVRKRDKRDNSWKVGPFWEERIISVFPGTDPNNPFLPVGQVVDVAQVEDRSVRESDGVGGAVEVPRKMPVWLRPHAGAQTPMCEALRLAEAAIRDWVSQHPSSYPPIVINISDGNASDGNPEPIAQQIMALATSDGNALLFNCHLSEKNFAPSQYPDNERALQDNFAQQMFRMSSVLPLSSREHAASLGIPISEQSRCCVFNADMVSLVQFLDVGTRGPSNLR